MEFLYLHLKDYIFTKIKSMKTIAKTKAIKKPAKGSFDAIKHLFGIWADKNIDAKELREKAWSR
jgi:hypothetical protein